MYVLVIVSGSSGAEKDIIMIRRCFIVFTF